MAKRLPVHRDGLLRDARSLRASIPSAWGKSVITDLIGELTRETRERRRLTKRQRQK